MEMKKEGGFDSPLVLRIHLNTECKDRFRLIDFCLKNDPDNQYVAIGWSKYGEFSSYTEYYNGVVRQERRTNPVLNLFKKVKEGDLFWTRDLEGNYWICRAKGPAETFFDAEMDIGAVVPVSAYKYGLEVPGQIKASFNCRNGGTGKKLGDPVIAEFSKKVYNDRSRTNTFKINENVSENLISNLPDFELEELVISYIQIQHNYYVLSNSIAKKSTTIKIECELISRDVDCPTHAVVQVKGGDSTLDAKDFEPYLSDGFVVFLYAKKILNSGHKNLVVISREELLDFYHSKKVILPDSITKWESILQ